MYAAGNNAQVISRLSHRTYYDETTIRLFGHIYRPDPPSVIGTLQYYQAYSMISYLTISIDLLNPRPSSFVHRSILFMHFVRNVTRLFWHLLYLIFSPV